MYLCNLYMKFWIFKFKSNGKKKIVYNRVSTLMTSVVIQNFYDFIMFSLNLAHHLALILKLEF